VIYFLQSPDGGPVKIGFTDNLPARHRALERHYGCPLAILATMDGDRAVETQIHERFAASRFGRTEQFRPTAELMEFIGRPLLVSPDPAAVEVMAKALETVKVDEEVIRKARIAASYKGVTLAEYLSEALRPIVDRDIEEGHAQLMAEQQEEPEGEEEGEIKPKGRRPKG
jgi:T5orf172 domain